MMRYLEVENNWYYIKADMGEGTLVYIYIDRIQPEMGGSTQ